MSYQIGGAIALANNGTLVLERCLFAGNSAGDWGGAIDVADSDLLMVDRCRFIQNTSPGFGGAIMVNGWVVVADITSSVFWQNSADQGGGGIEVWQTGQTAIVTNCTFHDNDAVAGEGASLRAVSGDLDVRNTILWGSVTDQIFTNICGTVTLAY
jgi:predicted outer membrane repeat protein